MAAVTKGLENLQQAIDACEQMSASLAEASDAEAVKAKTVVQETLSSFHEVSDKFFLKTMMSVPPTKACRVEAAALAALVSRGEVGRPAGCFGETAESRQDTGDQGQDGRDDDYMSGPILITGGAGSVGRSLVACCRADGYEVRVFDLPVCDFTGLEGETGIEVVKGDITNSSHVEAAVQGVSAVLHLAALLPPASEADRSRTFRVNVDGTAGIISAMQAAAGDAVLVFSSSVSTYGDTTGRSPAAANRASPDGPGPLRRKQDRQRTPGAGNAPSPPSC